MNYLGSKTARATKAISVLGAILSVLLFSVSLFSQANFGRILGTVTDQSGGVLSGATVTVIDTERGVTRTLITDDAGEYNAPTLIPSTYTVRVEAKGFRKLERQNIVLEVGKEVRVDLTPQPGEQAQTVTVTEQLPLVETTNATLGGTLNNADIQDMPLNGRNYQNLLSLRPGIVTYPGGGPWSQSTNNVRPDESGWMLDGVINANFYDARPISNQPSPLTDAATILPIDAIQEFNLEENPKAEYGWKPGAVVNVGVRSGTNTLHGSAYGFYRSSNWDARALFNPVTGNCANQAPSFCSQSPGQLKQFGGVVGGPVKKDKLFFFAGYEGLRSFIGQKLATTGIPETVGQTPADPANSMVDAINALKFASTPVPVSPVSLALTGCTVGATAAATKCTGGLWPSNTSNSVNYLDPLPNTNVSNNGVAKMDYHINSKHMLNGLLMIGDYTGVGLDHPIINQTMLNTFPIRTYTIGANEVWAANSRLVNEFRFGYNRVITNTLNNDSGKLADGTGLTGGSGYPINTGITAFGGLPNLYIGTLTVMGTWHNRPSSWDNNYSDFQDSVSYLVGKHSLKFGVEFAHIVVDSVSHDNARGRIDFSSLQNFFAGKPKNGRYFVGNAARTETWNSSAEFLQDDWRVTPKLTLNLGLRYSYESPIKEDNNLWGNFDPTKGMVQQGQPGVGPSLYKPDRKNFSPRVGFAWDVSGKGTTVVRAGASVIYSTFIAAEFLAQNGLQNTGSTSIAAIPTGACTVAVPVGQTCAQQPGGATFGGTIVAAAVKVPKGNLCWDPTPATAAATCAAGIGQGVVFPSGASPSCTAASPCNLLAVDPNLRTPYVTNWSLGVQHSFTNNLSFEVGYVGTHGARLTGFRDLNQGIFANIDPVTNPLGQPFYTVKDAAGNPMSYLNFINYMSNDGRSNYHSLQTTLTKRTSHGLSFTTGYTYGHGLDNGSLNRQGFLPADSRHPEKEYASGDFDVRHRLTVTATYDLPAIKGFAQMLEGWKLNSIVSLQSRQPWDVSESGANPFGFSNNNDNNDRWDFFGNPADFNSGANSFMYCTGPGNGGCSQTSGVSGASFCGSTPGPCTAAQSAPLWAKCTAVAADKTAGGTLAQAGCFIAGNSVIAPPALGKFGNMGRNIFRDSGFKNVDFSVFKTFALKERYRAEFRVEFFNVFNHPNIANPYGSVNGSAVGNDPSSPTTFGCGCATADIAGGSPFVSSGTPRAMQLGLKLTF